MTHVQRFLVRLRRRLKRRQVRSTLECGAPNTRNHLRRRRRLDDIPLACTRNFLYPSNLYEIISDSSVSSRPHSIRERLDYQEDPEREIRHDQDELWAFHTESIPSAPLFTCRTLGPQCHMLRHRPQRIGLATVDSCDPFRIEPSPLKSIDVHHQLV